MPEPLPPLKALRAFEEAYLTGSFTEAARRLNVQQPAISYQIKKLEDDLGVELFAREGGRLVPTAAARALFEAVTDAFQGLRRASGRLRQASRRAGFTIATYPGIGTHWLAPRLPGLAQALAMPVRIATLTRDADLLKESADCWILFGKGQWTGRDASLLMAEAVCPVAAPDLAARYFASRSAEEAEGLVAIDQDDAEERWISWAGWAEQTGGDFRPGAKRLVVNDHGFALHLALTGAGVCLAWTGVVADLIAGGSLVRLSEREATSDAGYWLVARSGFFDSRRGRLVRAALG